MTGNWGAPVWTAGAREWSPEGTNENTVCTFERKNCDFQR